MDDGWDFADPVDILSKLPENFHELLASKKWQDRKEALEALLNLATKNVRLDPKANYLEIIDTLTKVLAKDANVNVCALAAKCLAQFAKGLRGKFGIHVSSVAQVIFEKFKDKKAVLKDALVETIDAVYASSNMDVICEEVVAALGKSNPNIKIQTNLFLYRVFKSLNSQTAPKKVVKTLVPVIVKCTGDPDPETRESAFSALGAVMKAIGKNNAMTLLSDIANDKTKMTQIEKFCDQAMEEAPAAEEPKKTQPQKAAAPAQESVNGAETPRKPAASREKTSKQPAPCSSTAASAPKVVAEPDSWDFADPVDILSKLPENFHELLASKKWQDRKEALETLLNLATKNVRLDPKANYLEIIDTLSKVLAKDANINVCALAAKCLAQFAKGLRGKFSIHVSSVAQVIFEKFKDKKAVIKDALVETVDAVYASSNMDAICEEVVAALGKSNPNIKIQTNLFLYRVFKALNSQTAPKKVVKTLVPVIVKCTGDPDPETRESAFSALGAIMKAIGKNNTMTLLSEVANDKTKMAQIEKFYDQAMEEAPPVEEPKKAQAKKTPAAAQASVTCTAAPSKPAPVEEKPSKPSESCSSVDARAAVPKFVPEPDPINYADPADVLSKLPSRFAVSSEHYDPLPTFQFSPFPAIDFGLRKIDLDISTQQQLAALGLNETMNQPVIATKKETPRLNNYKKRLSTLRLNQQ